MIQHSRKPAIIVLALVLGIGGVMVWKSSNVSAQGAATDSAIAQWEKQIADGRATYDTWLHYGDGLTQLGRNTAAVAAYHKALEIEPINRDARIGYAVALARSNDTQTLDSFLRELASQDPKLTLNLLDHPECRSVLSKERFDTLYKEAKSQASD